MKNLISVFFSVSITLGILNLFNNAQGELAIYYSASFLDDIGNTITGFGRFFSALKSAADPIASLLGFKVIMLFLGILLISTGLSFLGLPRGKASFYTSLITADILWILWAWSFDPEDISYLDLFFSVIKTNLILLLPFIIISFLKRSPIITKKIKPAVLSMVKLPFTDKVTLQNSRLISMTEKYQDSSMNFQKSLFNDIIKDRDNEEITLSGETLNYGKDTRDLLNNILDDVP